MVKNSDELGWFKRFTLAKFNFYNDGGKSADCSSPNWDV